MNFAIEKEPIRKLHKFVVSTFQCVHIGFVPNTYYHDEYPLPFLMY